MTLRPNPDFKVTPKLDAEYLSNGRRYRDIFTTKDDRNSYAIYRINLHVDFMVTIF